jgi:glycopeptide antibiotics resistance protein
MRFQGILLYTLRAALFAAAASGIYWGFLRLRGRSVTAGRLLSAFYVAALVEITVLRGGVDWAGLPHAARDPVQWVPLRTTLLEFRGGAWPFLYHVLGNLLWFLPLGLMLRRKSAWRALLAGALLSASIECLQWVLLTGIPDVDDVLLNACGALLGWLLFRAVSLGRSRGHRSPPE